MRDWRGYEGTGSLGMTCLKKGLEKVSRKGLPGMTCLNEELKKVSRYRFTWYDVLE